MSSTKSFVASCAIGALLLASCASAPSITPVAVKIEPHFTGNFVDIMKADQIPQALSQPRPRYPQKFSGSGVTGQASTSFIVGVDGVPTQVQCATATDEAFGQAAVEAIKQWRYKPGRVGGKVVAILMSLNMAISE